MEKIVQLKDWEYQRLIKKADLKEDEIKDLSEKMYQEKGTFRLDLRFNFKDDYDWSGGFKVIGDIKDEKSFDIPLSAKKRIIDHAENRFLEYLEKKFNREFGDIYTLRKELKRVRRERMIMHSFTVLGWLMAVSITIYNLL
jgi:hypothetical protein